MLVMSRRLKPALLVGSAPLLKASSVKSTRGFVTSEFSSERSDILNIEHMISRCCKVSLQFVASSFGQQDILTMLTTQCMCMHYTPHG